MTYQLKLTEAALPPTGCRTVAGEASLQASPAQAVHKPFGLPKADNAGISAGLPADGPARNPRKGLGQGIGLTPPVDHAARRGAETRVSSLSLPRAHVASAAACGAFFRGGVNDFVFPR